MNHDRLPDSEQVALNRRLAAKEEAKALAKSAVNMQVAPAVNALDVSAYFDEDALTDNSDMLIPRILLMQGVSQLVGQQKASQGDIIDSVTHEVLATSKTPLSFIPIKQLDKSWVVEKWNGKKFEYDRVDTWDETLKDSREFEEEGVKKRRNQRLQFYVLLGRDAETHHLPYLLSFQRTGYQAGRILASYFKEALLAYRLGDKNSIPMGTVFELSCHVEQSDSGPYYVMDVKRTTPANTEQKTKAVYWFSQLRTQAYKVHEEAEIEAEVTPANTERRF